MSNKRLKRLGFTDEVFDRLSKKRLASCQDVLSKSKFELLQMLGLSYSAINQILDRTARACAPSSQTALDLLQTSGKQRSFLPTTLDRLDKIMLGGIAAGTITELAGPSGCGKTQFCMMLAALGSLPEELGGLGGGVMYIDTESAFSAERLVEIAQNKYPEKFTSDDTLVELTSRVHVCVESTCSTLLKRLEKLEEEVISKNIKLIILDSIASLVRKEFDGRISKNMAERTNLLAREAAILKYIAEEFMIPSPLGFHNLMSAGHDSEKKVVVTNQITTRFGVPREVKLNSSDEKPLENLEGEGGYVTAALGNTWSHCVNTRLIVQYLDGPRRQVLIAKSPVAPFAVFVYTIQNSGIVLEDDSGNKYDGTDPGLQKIRVRTAISQAAFEY